MNEQPAISRRALVLGSGGVTGVAWETGILFGLAEAGVDFSQADIFIGTSAGSVVAAQIATGIPLAELYESQISGATSEIAARLGVAQLLRYIIALAWPGDRQKARARLGHAALRAKTVPEAERRAVIARRLPVQEWPSARLLITALEAESGADVVFTKDDGVSLVDAVGASCAVPLVWPPVTINGRRYMDGGLRTTANVDLAQGYDRVVVIAPLPITPRVADRPAAQLAALGPGVTSVLISPDAAARVAIGRNTLDPARRAPAAQAGKAQAAKVAGQARGVWS